MSEDETVYYLESNGKRRRGEKRECKICGGEFIVRTSPSSSARGVFCSPACRNKGLIKRIVVNCHMCGVEIERTPSEMSSSKNGLSFCSRKCKERAQSLDWGRSDIWPAHYGIRTGCMAKDHSLMKAAVAAGCVGCDEKRIFVLALHHVDGNRSNNTPENIEVVCHNCHVLRHLLVNENGDFSHSTKHLTSRELLLDLQNGLSHI